jgi:hypothetical protein
VSVIETLTGEQLLQLGVYSERWRAVSRATAPADRPAAEEAVRQLYSAAGASQPIILWHDSPLAGYAVASMLARGAGMASIGRLPETVQKAVTASAGNLLAALYPPDIRPTSSPEDCRWAHIRRALWQNEPTAGDRVNVAFHNRLIVSTRKSADDALRGHLSTAAHTRIMAELSTPLERTVAANIGVMIRLKCAEALSGRSRSYSPISGKAHDLFFSPYDYCDWLARHDFAGEFGRPCSPMTAALLQLARSCGHIWVFPRIALLTDRPTLLFTDTQGRLDNPGGPAIHFKDGWGWHSLRGVPVPDRVIYDFNSYSARGIMAEPNTEIRRILIERYGEERFIRDAEAAVVHRDDFGTLYRLDLANHEPWVAVKVVNSTPEPDGSFRDYFLRVPPWMQTAREAVAWTFGMDEQRYKPDRES